MQICNYSFSKYPKQIKMLDVRIYDDWKLTQHVKRKHINSVFVV